MLIQFEPHLRADIGIFPATHSRYAPCDYFSQKSAISSTLAYKPASVAHVCAAPTTLGPVYNMNWDSLSLLSAALISACVYLLHRRLFRRCLSDLPGPDRDSLWLGELRQAGTSRRATE